MQHAIPHWHGYGRGVANLRSPWNVERGPSRTPGGPALYGHDFGSARHSRHNAGIGITVPGGPDRVVPSGGHGITWLRGARLVGKGEGYHFSLLSACYGPGGRE